MGATELCVEIIKPARHWYVYGLGNLWVVARHAAVRATMTYNSLCHHECI